MSPTPLRGELYWLPALLMFFWDKTFFPLTSQNHSHYSFDLKIISLRVGECVQRPEDSWQESILSFCHSDCEVWTQILSAGHEHLYPLSLLRAEPWVVYSKWHPSHPTPKQNKNQDIHSNYGKALTCCLGKKKRGGGSHWSIAQNTEFLVIRFHCTDRAFAKTQNDNNFSLKTQLALTCNHKSWLDFVL